MEVTLIATTALSPDFPTIKGLTPADSLIAYAVADCYQTEPNDKALKRCLTSGHTSVFEHLSFTFQVKGISRACLAQLTRHRIASYTVESQRYTNYTKKGKVLSWIIPTTIQEGGASPIIQGAYKLCEAAYEELISLGVPPEDARFVLPNAATTNLTMTFNARSLMNAFDLRLDHHAQWEIRELFSKIYHIVTQVAPVTFSNVNIPDEGGV